MANQIIIDIGAVANDGTGDPLRTAFNYVNNNFSNIWTTGVANSNISFSGNKILTTNVNGNLVLAPNGIGKVQANVDIIPNANNTLSLGSLARQWNTVYAQNLAVGGNVDFNNLTVDGNLTVNGTTTTLNTSNVDIEDKVITIAYGSPNTAVANGSGITIAGANANIIWSNISGWTMNQNLSVTGNITLPTGNIRSLSTVGTGLALYANTENSQQYTALSIGNTTTQVNGIISVFDAGGTGSAGATIGLSDGVGGTKTWYFNPSGITQLPGNITTTGNIEGSYFVGNGSQLTGIASYANSNAVAYGESGWAGNIIPSGNAVYSLGNATNQWNDLYVSNATIFMNNVPIGLSAGNVLTVNGNAVLQNNSNTTISTTGNITAGNVLTGGAVSATGNVSGAYVKGNGSELTNLPAPTVAQDIASTGAMSIMTYDGNLKYVSYATVEPASGNITGGNILTGGLISATGNITGGNLTVGSGTITGGNVNGAIFNGNVAFGTGTVGGSGNIAGGNISATGNVTAGNIVTSGSGGDITMSGGNITGAGNISAGNVNTTGNVSGNTAGFAIGYRDIPQVSFTGNATIATTDAGKHFYSTLSTGNVLTIANNASQGFQVGAAITVVNQGTGTITVAQGANVTLYLAGNATSGNRSVATFGMATLIKVDTDTWFINGTGVS